MNNKRKMKKKKKEMSKVFWECLEGTNNLSWCNRETTMKGKWYECNFEK
jgi:hypothetical protein